VRDQRIGLVSHARIFVANHIECFVGNESKGDQGLSRAAPLLVPHGDKAWLAHEQQMTLLLQVLEVNIAFLMRFATATMELRHQRRKFPATSQALHNGVIRRTDTSAMLDKALLHEELPTGRYHVGAGRFAA